MNDQNLSLRDQPLTLGELIDAYLSAVYAGEGETVDTSTDELFELECNGGDLVDAITDLIKRVRARNARS